MSAVVLDSPLALAAKRLIGASVECCERLGGGRNARVFRVESVKGRFALKQYPSRADDPRDRLNAEREALQWMASAGLATVPRFVAADEAHKVSLLTWVDGSPVAEVNVSDIDQAADFLGALHEAGCRHAFPPARLASEACLSGSEIERQLRARVQRLKALDNEPALQAFLDGRFAQSLEDHIILARRLYAFENELTTEWRRPTPSDFGFHNALRDARGRLSFIDFEYFGWDDPVKLACDLMLHPGTLMAEPLRKRLRARLLALHADDTTFVARFEAFLPLFALRWTLILLNEYHPERWRNRVLAGEGDAWESAKQRQLVRARTMLEKNAA